ncbi:unnamed protein product [[Candida] boidinii]|uniref:Unnamed protein product n=1 Tax=Candida boidinii TaxID=5477 RepID=A0A9W6T3S0_CANBO|nr:hypothetical protein B5S30_g2566 [[Candida] boidinii]GME75466.1 unnamed protein product [[Candida] boidinii]GMG06014.1 unnamed protein product [[Candida] boidinii]
MSVHNPNNCALPWAKEYLNENLTKASVSKDGKKIYVHQVGTVTGDCDVTQRKGKVRCIYDLKVSFNVNIKDEKEQKEESEEEVEDKEVSFPVELLEFFHDQDEDEYQFSYKHSNPEEIKLVKSSLIPEILKVFMAFQSDLLESHESQLKHNTN